MSCAGLGISINYYGRSHKLTHSSEVVSDSNYLNMCIKFNIACTIYNYIFTYLTTVLVDIN